MQTQPTQPATRTQEQITTQDGWRLSVELLVPESPIGVVVLGHAMMVNRRTMDKPKGKGLASVLAASGLAVVMPDLRGHGQSGPLAAEGGRWSYDDLVYYDTPALASFARRRFPARPLCLAGHSLFGHVSAAFSGRSPEPPEALVLLAANIWLPGLEPSYLRWLAKRATLEALLPISRRVGYTPAKRTGFGSEDEPLDYFEQFLVWARGGRWCSRSGEDFLQGLSRYRGKTLSMVGAGDSLNCRPVCAKNFAQHLGGSVDFRVVGRASGLSFDPGHMALLTDARSAPAWSEVARWIIRAFSS